MDKDFWFQMGVTAILTALRDSFKSEPAKAKLKPAMLKIAGVIFALWGEDTQFEDAVFARAEYEREKMRFSS